MGQSDLESALAQLEAVETNLHRIEAAAREMVDLAPSGTIINASGPEKQRHDDLVRSYNQLRDGLPPIEGWQIDEATLDYTSMVQWRIDLIDLGEPRAEIDFQAEVDAPLDQLAEYRHRFNRSRARVVRQRVEDLVAVVNSLLPPLSAAWEHGPAVVDDERFEQLRAAYSEIDRLVGASSPRKARWSDLSRHLAFGQGHDLHDIARMDWPSVRAEIRRVVYDDSEPVPVMIADVADLVSARPLGAVTTELFWSNLDPSEFERLVYNLLLDTSGCENVDWLMHTNAPERMSRSLLKSPRVVVPSFKRRVRCGQSRMRV